MNVHVLPSEANSIGAADAESNDPLLALIAERARQATPEGAEDAEIDAAADREDDIDEQLTRVRATSVDGALAAADLLRHQFHEICAENPQVVLWLSLLASIEGVLQSTEADAAAWREGLFAIEPTAHNAKAYAEATRILVEQGREPEPNTVIKVAYLAQDATVDLLEQVLQTIEAQRR